MRDGSRLLDQRIEKKRDKDKERRGEETRRENKVDKAISLMVQIGKMVGDKSCPMKKMKIVSAASFTLLDWFINQKANASKRENDEKSEINLNIISILIV